MDLDYEQTIRDSSGRTIPVRESASWSSCETVDVWLLSGTVTTMETAGKRFSLSLRDPRVSRKRMESGMGDMIRWGILGTGKIAGRLAAAINSLDDADLVAIGSRSSERAEAFAREYDVPHRFDRYEDLVTRSEVDVVYVATPHVFHERDTLLSLEAGKPVLCEKPFTMNAKEATTVIAAAREKSLFLMEAMWTRFVPAIVKLREWIAAGAIGEVRVFMADAGWAHPFDPMSRFFDPALGGGALLDVGVYPLSMASMILGTPTDVSSLMTPAPTGVDAQCTCSLAFADGGVATFTASIVCKTPREGLVVGSEGSIRIHSPINHPEALTRITQRGEAETVELPYLGNGYAHQVIEVMECLREGRFESDIMPLDESLAIMQTLDAIREQWS